MSLLARTIGINAAIVVSAFAVLILTPVALVPPFEPQELVVIAALLVILLAIGTWAISRSLAPLRSLHQDIAGLGGLGESRRLAEAGAPEVEAVARAFNGLLDRLAGERRARTRAILLAQEAERLRIARELHDEIGQTLTFSLMSLANVAADHPGWEGELAPPRESLRAALEEVRGVASALRPGVLEDLGLRAALDDLIQRAERDSGLRIRRRLSVPEDLSSDEELVIFRICQESLTNALRHGHAQAIEVSLGITDGRLVLEVGDDGIGYAGGRGSGITGMAERADLVDATLTVGPGPAAGTVVRLELPPKEVR